MITNVPGCDNQDCVVAAVQAGVITWDKLYTSEPLQIDEERDTTDESYHVASQAQQPKGPKDYSTTENNRNYHNETLFTDMVQAAFGVVPVMVAHHINFQRYGDIRTINEIPSADTLLFDHDIMRAIFKEFAVRVMQALAANPVETRDVAAKTFFYNRHNISDLLK